MAENVYERIVRVISKPANLRTDEELHPLTSWFRKKTEIFKRLKTDQLIDVLKNCQNQRKKRDDVLIKQGEKGDCFFITLSGQVSIYIKYAKPQEGDERSKEEAQSTARPEIDDDNRRCKDRSKLGTFVCSLGVGESFGEMALISDDCIRTATIVADETTDCICIDRALYNRSIRMSLEREFEEKINFIQTNPVFSNWAPRYKKQLAMAFQRETLTYETIIKRQGDVVDEIYFIISGEVKLKINPAYHPSQYASVFTDGIRHDAPHYHKQDDDKFSSPSGTPLSLLSTPAPLDPPRTQGGARGRTRAARPSRSVPVCLLGINEVIGDAEVLYSLRTHMQTSVCNSKVDLLVLGLRHFERLIVKRNPQALELMRKSMITRMQNRQQMGLACQIPLYDIFVLSAQPKHQDDEVKRHSKSTGFQLPPRGPLIDHFGPGTVFYRIRQRGRIMAKRSKTLAHINPSSKSQHMRPTDSASYGGRTGPMAHYYPPTMEGKARTTLTAVP